MTPPSPEMVAAALRLAEAALKQQGRAAVMSDVESRTFVLLCDAYRATLPRLRTEAIIALDALLTLRMYHTTDPITGQQSRELYEKLRALAAEPTAEEPATECDWCQDSTVPELVPHTVPAQHLHVCRRCLAEREKNR